MHLVLVFLIFYLFPGPPRISWNPVIVLRVVICMLFKSCIEEREKFRPNMLIEAVQVNKLCGCSDARLLRL